jgi:tRNA modification GTPase
MKSTTIAAISTPFGNGGIGIIRLSGSRSVPIASSLFQRSQKNDPNGFAMEKETLASHRFYHGRIIDPDTRDAIDEVLFVIMRSPRSYTREDVVEIHSHSGPVVMGKIYEQVLAAGASMAEPGEFTKRAFINGRIDLTQAEAVADIIDAKTGMALKVANRQLAGGLSEKIIRIREALLETQAMLEATIDFSDDVQDDIQREAAASQLEEGVLKRIEKLLRDYEQDHFYRDGVKMAVIGRPNVGKSSLMNCLIKRERSIVTAIPGTTRDVIEEMLHIKGLPVVIMDTAGLHEARGEVEKMGIQKTRQSIKDADIVLFMVDNSQPLSPEDIAIYSEITHKTHLVVKNKIDLISDDKVLRLPGGWGQQPCVKISALNGTHIDELKQMIWTVMIGEAGANREVGIVPNLRHKKGLEKCLAASKRGRAALINGLPEEMVVADIQEAAVRLDRLLGGDHRPDILDQVFSRFCIGK